MNQNIKIGLLGTLINNTNMGCVALTYSLIGILERIAKEQNLSFKYFIFEDRKNNDMIERLCKELNINKSKILSFPIGCLSKIISIVHHPIKALQSYQHIKECDLFIDLTSGDSFSDIYGQWRFDGASNVKLLIEKMKKPLLLGPQTYGPFNKKKNIKRAKQIIEKADYVISRDQISADYIKQFTNKVVTVTTDLAFELPHKKLKIKDTYSTLKIGINASGLLIKNKTEPTSINFKLMTDYDQFLENLIHILLENPKHEIHIIPHVGNDACSDLKRKFPNLIYLKPFNDPVSAKNAISEMDIFIGARMHATIAAFSTGIATIPTAYSRKFRGVYENLEYKYIIDMEHLTTDEAVSKTIEYIENHEILKNDVKRSLEIIKIHSNKTYNVLCDFIKNNTNRV